MGKPIEYWCLRKFSISECRFVYFCLVDGAPGITSNASHALRYFSENGAKDTKKAWKLDRHWKPHQFAVLADEFAGSSVKIDGLLNNARACFILADYHPFGNIENEIHAALRSPDYSEKIRVLRKLPDMLDKSDYASTRALAAEIRSCL